MIVCAVNVPRTVKLSAEEAVSALVAQLAVPKREPVIIGALREPVICKPFVYLPEPDTSNENIGRG
jgi:hypothetical protein